jgi:hypothetical protein
MDKFIFGFLSIPLTSVMSYILLYIDPGTGSIILQALVAAVAGISIAVKLYWRRLQVFFGFRQKVEADITDESEKEE